MSFIAARPGDIDVPVTPSLVGGQDLAQHGTAQAEQPGADHLLGGAQARIAAAQRPGCLAGEPS